MASNNKSTFLRTKFTYKNQLNSLLTLESLSDCSCNNQLQHLGQFCRPEQTYLNTSIPMSN